MDDDGVGDGDGETGERAGDIGDNDGETGDSDGETGDNCGERDPSKAAVRPVVFCLPRLLPLGWLPPFGVEMAGGIWPV